MFIHAAGSDRVRAVSRDTQPAGKIGNCQFAQCSFEMNPVKGRHSTRVKGRFNGILSKLRKLPKSAERTCKL